MRKSGVTSQRRRAIALPNIPGDGAIYLANYHATDVPTNLLSERLERGLFSTRNLLLLL
ncbi:hypothetical protein NOVOSPHI9U_420244 [Novosphingobium sp. 9U]|nr:hypothetical protein NOVOSPHI9U_420244 [Novosphingobium sp. 9U]